MKAYLTYFRIRLLNSLQYRAAALGGLITQFFWGFMEIQLYSAFYAEHADRFPMALPHLVSYIWLRQAFLTRFRADAATANSTAAWVSLPLSRE